MRISVQDLSKRPHLAGATTGEQHLRKVWARLDSENETVLFDFAGIDTATSSYLKALLFGFYEDASRPERGITVKPAFPILVRLSNIVREEVSQLATLSGRQLVEGVRIRGDEILLGRLIGKLDPALETTLNALIKKGAATATDLHLDAGERIAITAWNNRLADLYGKRLAKRRRVGKQWIYEPIAREFEHG